MACAKAFRGFHVGCLGRFRRRVPGCSRVRTLSHSSTKGTFGVVLDVDGVLIRGKQRIAGAREVLVQLQREGIPHIFMTNSGGFTEQSKADVLANMFDIEIHESQMCLAHTPMQELASLYKEKVVLVVGKPYERLSHIISSYGFEHHITAEQLHEQLPVLYPDLHISQPKLHLDLEGRNIGAVLVMNDPYMWGRDIQVCLDVLRSNGELMDHNHPEQIPCYNACSDFEWAAEFHIPRLGAGSFRVALETLYEKSTGRALKQEFFGKPNLSQYRFVERMLAKMAQERGLGELTNIYAIGDNPYTDIMGANRAGEKWRSVLTRTGMFQGSSNHDEHPADLVVEDVSAALREIKLLESQQQ